MKLCTFACLLLVGLVFALPARLFAQPTTTQVSFTDSFTDAQINTCHWFDFSFLNNASITANALTLHAPSGPDLVIPRISTQYSLLGDFDVIVSVMPGEGWISPFNQSGNSSYLNIDMRIGIDEANSAQIALQRFAPSTISVVAGRRESGVYSQIARQSINLLSTLKFRLKRSANTLSYFYSTGAEWQLLGATQVNWKHAFITLESASFSSGIAFNAAFDDFSVSADALTMDTARQNVAFRKREDFMVGGVLESYGVWNYWGQSWGSHNPIANFAKNGMDHIRIPVSTVWSNKLRNKPPAQWPAIWDGEFWIANEVRFQMMRLAHEAGMKVVPAFYFSDVAANFSAQQIPSAWEGYSLEQLIVAVHDHAKSVAQELLNEGIDVSYYELGNEIDIGLLEYRPGEKIPVPLGVHPTTNVVWMRQNVWNITALLVQAAIEGIREVQKDAVISLHIASLISEREAGYFAKAFFDAMIDAGVQFDLAGISIPYSGRTSNNNSEWQLYKYSMDCWLSRIGELSNYLEVRGKPMVIAEASYAADPAGQSGTPIPGLPYTEQGQAEWMRRMLAYASNKPNIKGFFYFYPDWFDRGFGDSSTIELNAYGFYRDANSPRAILQELNVNLASVNEMDPAAVKAVAMKNPLVPALSSDGSLTTAAFRAGASLDQGQTGSQAFTTQQHVLLAGQVNPEFADVGKSGEIFIAIRYAHMGLTAWFYRDIDETIRPWNGLIEDLRPAYKLSRLEETNSVQVFNGKLPEGNLQIFIGYKQTITSEPLHYSGTGLQVEVTE